MAALYPAPHQSIGLLERQMAALGFTRDQDFAAQPTWDHTWYLWVSDEAYTAWQRAHAGGADSRVDTASPPPESPEPDSGSGDSDSDTPGDDAGTTDTGDTGDTAARTTTAGPTTQGGSRRSGGSRKASR